MASSHGLLKLLRKVHLYLGVFTTPALLFFAFTGAMQSANLHETAPGSSYKPPEWIKELAQLHKKQTTEVPVRRGRPGGEAGVPGGSAGPGGRVGTGPGDGKVGTVAGGPVTGGPVQPAKGHWPMKIFFVLVSAGLFTTTLTGLYMAYRYTRRPWVISGVLAAGLVLPLLLLPF